jgi:hypothetical protein
MSHHTSSLAHASFDDVVDALLAPYHWHYLPLHYAALTCCCVVQSNPCLPSRHPPNHLRLATSPARLCTPRQRRVRTIVLINPVRRLFDFVSTLLILLCSSAYSDYMLAAQTQHVLTPKLSFYHHPRPKQSSPSFRHRM